MDSVAGVVIASPSRQDPDYYFHWIRDSALVIDSLLITVQPQDFSSTLFQKNLNDYILFSRRLQLTPSQTGLGEPRFNVDGTAFNGPWARPQNDGPALRALTLLHALQFNLSAEQRNKISEILETDLDFIQSHRDQPSFDIWEEIRADHFYTRVAQMAALKKAIQNFDPAWKFSIFDCEAARAHLESNLQKHWSDEKKYFSISQNRVEGGDNKKTDLDTAVILGVLHAGLNQDILFSVRNDRVLATAEKLEKVFERIYEINQSKKSFQLAPAIGRYEDDVYFGGNPWYLTTLAFAELHYRLAESLQQDNNFEITDLNFAFLSQAGATKIKDFKPGLNLKNSSSAAKELTELLRLRGDQFVERVRLHTPKDGSLAEQFSRKNGYATSARDLTWSYASFLTAIQARTEISKGVSK